MKIRHILFGLALLFFGCKEDKINNLKVDSTSPGELSDIQVINTPGGAIINYKLPSDLDVLYVEASYELANGEKKNIKSSFNYSSLLVEGFSLKNSYLVKLQVTDKSGNKSKEVQVKINPLDPPIILIENSLKMSPDFGGVRFTWENKMKVPMALLVYANNDKNEEILIDTYYSDKDEGEFILRGLDAVEKNFTVVVRDKWDNLSKRVSQKLTPIFETKLDVSKFSDMGPTYRKNISSNTITAIWDKKKEERAVEGTTAPWYASFDLGVEAKISRLVFWQMGWPFNDYGHYYSSHNANLINVYGSNKPNPNGETDGTWILLKSCVIVKPSGLPTAMDRNAMTDNDFDLARNKGHEFIISLDAPNVRYIRVEPVRSWESTEGQFSELELFGAPINK